MTDAHNANHPIDQPHAASPGTSGSRRVLITGASIAGPAAAFWLDRAGWNTTVLERTPTRRMTGQNIDVRGPGRTVVERMGVLDAVKAANTGEIGTQFIDSDGKPEAEFPADTSGDDGTTAELEILHGDLSTILVDASPTARYRYDDTVTALTRARRRRDRLLRRRT
jgi:2-polyprenyl-6-methoxyphenol hydroxylase-like FAD-dependent oxidoreductase